MSLPDLVAVRTREPGTSKILELFGGIAVECRVPQAGEILEAEAAAQTAMAALQAMPELQDRYGFQDSLTEEQVAARSRHVIAVEAAARFWTDWNFGEPTEPAAEGEAHGVRKRSLKDVRQISLLLSDPQMRSAWLIQLDALSPLEFLQGNGSAASPGTISDEAASSAETAGSESSPAPGADANETERPVPEQP